MSENLNQWMDIPSDSTFHLSVRGKTNRDANFVSNARALPTKGSEQNWWDHELQPGPRTMAFAAETSYAVRATVKFLGTAVETAVIRAQVLDAAGQPHPDWWGNTEYVYEVTGQSGSNPQRVTLFLIGG